VIGVQEGCTAFSPSERGLRAVLSRRVEVEVERGEAEGQTVVITKGVLEGDLRRAVSKEAPPCNQSKLETCSWDRPSKNGGLRTGRGEGSGSFGEAGVLGRKWENCEEPTAGRERSEWRGRRREEGGGGESGEWRETSVLVRSGRGKSADFRGRRREDGGEATAGLVLAAKYRGQSNQPSDRLDAVQTPPSELLLHAR
jgi:hypothetical protein